MSHAGSAFQLVAPLPSLGGLPFDRLIIRLGHLEPMALVRIVPPDYHAVADALDQGILLPLNPPCGHEQFAAYLRSLGPEKALKLFQKPAPPLRSRWRQRLGLG